ncbi:MAG TPA: SAM-dependent methyltransferase, partial [Nannocystis sp.]
MNVQVDKPISAVEARERAQWIAFAPFVFQAACALRDHGILRAIAAKDGGLSLEEVAEAVGLPLYGTRVLLEAGLGIGLVSEHEGRYRLTKVGVFLEHDPMTRANMN